jgi:MutS domain I
LLEIGLQLALDHRKRNKKRTVGNFDRQLAIGVLIFAGDAVLGESAAGAVNRNAIRAEAGGGGGKLGVGHRDRKHWLSVKRAALQWASLRCDILKFPQVSDPANIPAPHDATPDATEDARLKSVLARADESSQTPVMRQYFAAKAQHPDCLMFCRIGDFYELFYEDAIVASRELQLTLTARDKARQQPMCGVPYHSAAIYLQRLLRKGYKIALCEQMEDPKAVKGIVRRWAQEIASGSPALRQRALAPVPAWVWR